MPSTKYRSCGNKTPYDTKTAANKGMRYYMSIYGAAAGSMEIYQCNHCKKFHFGHKKRRKAN